MLRQLLLSTWIFPETTVDSVQFWCICWRVYTSFSTTALLISVQYEKTTSAFLCCWLCYSASAMLGDLRLSNLPLLYNALEQLLLQSLFELLSATGCRIKWGDKGGKKSVNVCFSRLLQLLCRLWPSAAHWGWRAGHHDTRLRVVLTRALGHVLSWFCSQFSMAGTWNETRKAQCWVWMLMWNGSGRWAYVNAFASTSEEWMIVLLFGDVGHASVPSWRQNWNQMLLPHALTTEIRGEKRKCEMKTDVPDRQILSLRQTLLSMGTHLYTSSVPHIILLPISFLFKIPKTVRTGRVNPSASTQICG